MLTPAASAIQRENHKLAILTAPHNLPLLQVAHSENQSDQSDSRLSGLMQKVPTRNPTPYLMSDIPRTHRKRRE
jgi:hypothetical protein